MESHARSHATSSWLLGPVLLVVLGVAVTGIGVALNESGVEAGRALVVAGLAIVAVSLIYAVVRRPRAARRRAAPPNLAGAVARLASTLGLALDDGKASGSLRDRRIEAEVDGDGVRLALRAHVKRALDMGLTVMRGRPPGDARREVTSGDPAFDAIYAVRADEPARATACLGERLRAQLLEVDARLDDAGVQLLVPVGPADALVESMKLACKIASEVERASTRVPCAEAFASARATWLEFARDHNLASADTPLSMWGTIDGMAVAAVAVRDAFQHHHFELTAEFPESLGRGLALKPASSVTQFDRTGEPLGHPAFDKVFALKAKDPVDGARLVGPETREAILALRDSGLQIRAHDAGLWAWVGFHRDNPELVPTGLQRMANIAARIAANARRYPKR
jgi:hypothetical protein